MSIITVEDVSKRYRKGQTGYHTLREDLYNLSGSLFHLRKKRLEDADEKHILALKDVSFQIEQGERVGVIGRNGSGKTTLLRLLAGITRPTHGKIAVKGRLGVLIELMAGFHPELTGRENVYLNGAIMGMTQKEVRRKFDEIVAFAELEDFIDTPIKRYSSGMHVRLGFAVAAHLDPEILLVDEVLAVGDAAFQKKCLGKMSVAAQEGRTVVFVSHNMTAVKSLCNRAIWLQDGRVKEDGEPGIVVSKYLETSSSIVSGKVWNDAATAPGNDRARVHAVRFVDADGRSMTLADIEDPIMVEVEYWVLVPGTVLNVSISLFSQEEVYVLASPSITDRNWYQRPHPAGLFRSRCTIPGRFLNQGQYRLTALLVESVIRPNIIAQLDKVVTIDMIDTGASRKGYFGYWGGVVRPVLEWETECLHTV